MQPLVLRPPGLAHTQRGAGPKGTFIIDFICPPAFAHGGCHTRAMAMLQSLMQSDVCCIDRA